MVSASETIGPPALPCDFVSSAAAYGQFYVVFPTLIVLRGADGNLSQRLATELLPRGKGEQLYVA